MDLIEWLLKKRKENNQKSQQIVTNSVQTPKQVTIDLLKPINIVEIKAHPLFEFAALAIKFATREVIGVGVGTYDSESKKVRIMNIFPALDAPSGAAYVNLNTTTHQKLDEALKHWNWNDGEKLAVFHSHPGFGCEKSVIDDEHGSRMAALLFAGKAVSVIVDPFHEEGIKIAAYAIDPETKLTKKIPFKVVP
jgi:proteasome lid subunit RPN8/RPN11